VVRQPQQLLRRRLHRPAGAAAARDTDTNAYTYRYSDSNRHINTYAATYTNGKACADSEASPDGCA
jgi:hypothetical protein